MKWLLYLTAALILTILRQWVRGMAAMYLVAPAIYFLVGFIQTRYLAVSSMGRAVVGLIVVNLQLAVFLWILGEIFHTSGGHGYMFMNLVMAIMAYVVMPLSSTFLGYITGLLGSWVGNYVTKNR